MPSTRIADLRENVHVRITGHVRPIKSLISPCTSRPCVGFKATLIMGDRSHEVSELASFTIDDGTGRALIASDNQMRAELELEVDVSRTVPASKIRDIPLVRELGWRGLSDHLGVVIYDEAILAADAIATVWGIATREVLPMPGIQPAGYRDAGDWIMRLTRSPNAPIRISSRYRA